jgi:hypothetical protein
MAAPPSVLSLAIPRLFVAAGVMFWVCSALAVFWEGLALQSPVSALHLGVLVGPVSQLRNGTFAFGTGCFGLAATWSRIFEPGKGLFPCSLLLGSAAFHTFALAFAAAQGLLAVQFADPRADAHALVLVRLISHGLTTLGLLLVLLPAVGRVRCPLPDTSG